MGKDYKELKRLIVDRKRVPPDWPNVGPRKFWEEFGRTSSSFAFLEHILLDACSILKLERTREYHIIGLKKAIDCLEKILKEDKIIFEGDRISLIERMEKLNNKRKDLTHGVIFDFNEKNDRWQFLRLTKEMKDSSEAFQYYNSNDLINIRKEIINTIFSLKRILEHRDLSCSYKQKKIISSWRVDEVNDLPFNWPTHIGDSIFWEELGKVLSTFAFLEYCLSKTYFAWTGSRPCKQENIEEIIFEWNGILTEFATSTLSPQIKSIEKAFDDGRITKDIEKSIIKRLRELLEFRNILFHTFWEPCNSKGDTLRLIYNRRIDRSVRNYSQKELRQVHEATKEMIFNLTDIITTHFGLNLFPERN